jgi:HSP90 family molecular chaperone
MIIIIIVIIIIISINRDMFAASARSMRLYVKRVFINDKFEDLVSPYPFIFEFDIYNAFNSISRLQ